MRGKWYVSESVAEFAQEQVLENTGVSRMRPQRDGGKTSGELLGATSKPVLSVLPGGLQARFIDPQRRELEALGSAA